MFQKQNAPFTPLTLIGASNFELEDVTLSPQRVRASSLGKMFLYCCVQKSRTPLPDYYQESPKLTRILTLAPHVSRVLINYIGSS